MVTGTHVHLGASADEKYYISNITVFYVHDEHFPNSTTPGEKSQAQSKNIDKKEASATGYYTCNANSTVFFDKPEVKLYTTDFKYRAFNENGDINFNTGNQEQCPEDDETSSVVPIAVGAALAALVLIVLVAYLIGRKRSRKTGYENV